MERIFPEVCDRTLVKIGAESPAFIKCKGLVFVPLKLLLEGPGHFMLHRIEGVTVHGSNLKRTAGVLGVYVKIRGS